MNNFKRIAVVTSHLAPGDAVSNDVVGMFDAFLKNGYDARMYAGSCDFDDPVVHPISGIHSFIEQPDDVIIYHHSIAWTPGRELLRDAKCQIGIKYHNITPAEFFTGISPWHEEMCRTGREELREIARAGCHFYLADSIYNRDELLQLGAPAEKCFVVPPFHHIDTLESLDADMDTLDIYRDGKVNVLMVSRIAPHKGHVALIEAFASYYLDYNSNSRLIIVGKEEEPFEKYSKKLRDVASDLMLNGAVVFTGPASPDELKSYYLLSNLFAIASEHEGFCVPIVEAMALKVPVLAYASSAIPDTLGDGGMLLDERNALMMAAAMHRLIEDEGLSFNFAVKGRQRYLEKFTNEKIETTLFSAFDQLRSE